jgi:hypothetical protein
MDFTQAAFELHRKYPMLTVAEDIEDALSLASCEDALRHNLHLIDPVIVAMIEQVQEHGLFERDPGVLEPSRPLIRIYGARNDAYVFGSSASDGLAADRGVLAA